jgi:tetrahydromethanopterin S-methyltransferase subunit H
MKKEIDWTKFNKEQIKFIELMSDPDVRMTNAEMAKEIGINERSIYRYKQDADIVEAINILSDRYMDSMVSRIYKKLMQSVENGSVKGMELALKRAGKLKDIKEVQQDTNITVQAIDGKTNQQLLEEIKRLEEKQKNIIDITPVIDGGDDD